MHVNYCGWKNKIKNKANFLQLFEKNSKCYNYIYASYSDGCAFAML